MNVITCTRLSFMQGGRWSAILAMLGPTFLYVGTGIVIDTASEQREGKTEAGYQLLPPLQNSVYVRWDWFTDKRRE